MGAELNTCGNISRILLVIINIIFIAVAGIVLGIGSWLVHVNADFTFITGSSIIGGAALLIIAGGVTIIICVVGILGAIFKWRPLLVVYAIVVTVIVILEIAGGILAFVYRNRVGSAITSGAERAIRAYRFRPDDPDFDSSAQNSVDAIQNTFDCCGFQSVEDWIEYNPRVTFQFSQGTGNPPESCPRCTPAEDLCANFTGNYFDEDNMQNLTITFQTLNRTCQQSLEDRVILFGSVGGAIGVVFGFLEIVGIILALGVCCCIHSARRQQVV